MDSWEVGLSVETGFRLRSSQARSRVRYRRMRSLVWKAREPNGMVMRFFFFFSELD